MKEKPIPRDLARDIRPSVQHRNRERYRNIGNVQEITETLAETRTETISDVTAQFPNVDTSDLALDQALADGWNVSGSSRVENDTNEVREPTTQERNTPELASELDEDKTDTTSVVFDFGRENQSEISNILHVESSSENNLIIIDDDCEMEFDPLKFPVPLTTDVNALIKRENDPISMNMLFDETVGKEIIIFSSVEY